MGDIRNVVFFWFRDVTKQNSLYAGNHWERYWFTYDNVYKIEKGPICSIIESI